MLVDAGEPLVRGEPRDSMARELGCFSAVSSASTLHHAAIQKSQDFRLLNVWFVEKELFASFNMNFSPKVRHDCLLALRG
jgi:hypothetical protein